MNHMLFFRIVFLGFFGGLILFHQEGHTQPKPSLLVMPERGQLTIPLDQLQPLFPKQHAPSFVWKKQPRSPKTILHVQKPTGAGFVIFQTPKIKVHAATSYRLELRFQTPKPVYASFVSLLIRQFKSPQSRPAHYRNIPRVQRVVLPTRPGESIPRYNDFMTHGTTRYITASIVITGNPNLFHIRSLRLLHKREERRHRAPRPFDKLGPRSTMLQQLKKRPNATAQVVRQNGQVQLLLNGRQSIPVLYNRNYWRNEESLHDLFQRRGVQVHVVPIQLGPFTRDAQNKLIPGVWRGPNQYDFRHADAAFERALRINPNLYLIASLTLHPYERWGDQYPNDVARNSRNQKAICRGVHNKRYGNQRHPKRHEWWCPSLFSNRYRQQTAAALRAWLKHAQKQPYFKALIGVSLLGGDDGQWGNWSRSGILNLGDYSPAARTAFRRWLKQTYPTDRAFQKAWNTKKTRNQAQIPSLQARRGVGRIFFSPALDRPVIDHFRFQCQEKSRTIEFFAKTIKAAADKPFLCGSYYEDGIYGRHNVHWNESIRQRSRHLDFFASPLDYTSYRRPGWGGGYNAAIHSLQLHGKLFFQELDFRTHVSRYYNANYEYFTLGRLTNARDFQAVNRREIGLAQAHGIGHWYYTMAGGSFYAPYAKQGIQEAVRIAQWGQKQISSTWKPDVAVFVDEASAAYVSPTYFNSVMFSSTSAARSALWLSGVPFHLYNLQDLTHQQLPSYKVYIFLNSFYLNKAQRKFIRTQLQRDKKTIVWLHAAGYIDETGLSLANMEPLLGFRLGLQTKLQTLAVQPVSQPGFSQRNLWQGTAIPATVGAKFFVQDPTATVLGRYIRGNEVAIAQKHFPQWTSIYIAKPGGLGPDLLHQIARQAGAFTLTAPGAVSATNGNILVLHGAFGPTQRTIQLPFRAKVSDLLTGKTLATKTRQLSLKLDPKQTRLLGLQPR